MLKKGQQIIAPRTTAVRRATKPPKVASSNNHNDRDDSVFIIDPTNTNPATLLTQMKRALEKNRNKWTRDLPEPTIPMGVEEFREVERILTAQTQSPDQSPSWNLARHSWKSMDLRSQFEHHYSKPEDNNGKEVARKSRWNRLEARRRVRVHSKV
ncbi:hypothetical protein F5X99DRAFT_68942 [Biscogniauxia marginata]|nr:hypothetical protein F5X99DRAFT_68942 [Biscogniauxia marginata]